MVSAERIAKAADDFLSSTVLPPTLASVAEGATLNNIPDVLISGPASFDVKLQLVG